MHAPPDITITLELTVDGDEVGGRASAAGGEERPFHGWLGLMGTIDALVAGARPPGATAPATAPSDD